MTYLGLEAQFQTCELAPGTSVYGDADWSWFPPGVECTYDEDSLGRVARHIDSPSLDRLAIALVLMLWPLTLAAVRAEAKAHGESSAGAARDIANPS